MEFNREVSFAAREGKKIVDAAKLQKYMTDLNATPENTALLFKYFKEHGDNLPHVPCCAIHPETNSCTSYCIGVWFNTFLDMIPVYLSLNTVPLLLFKAKSVMQEYFELIRPLDSLKRVIRATAQSCSFLSNFVFMFQTGLCLYRHFDPHSSDRYFFYILGAITGLSILVEQKSKRSELAMYVLPKGLQSLYVLLLANGKMIEIPYLDVISTSAAMSIIMSLYQLEPHQMSSLMYKFMKQVIGTY